VAARSIAIGLHVDVQGLGFRHDPQRPLFDQLELSLAPGSTTCLTGASGLGKSTLLSLLTKLVEPTRGRLLLDGLDLRDLTPAAVRALVALAPQNPWLHNGTIRDNITYGLPDVGALALSRAVELTGLDEVVRPLRRGLATPIGVGGQQLSGGQQRRIALARAVVRQTPLLLLDEPTTGLDDSCAHQVMTDLLRATRRTTVLIVTHDLRLAALADRTVALHPGGTLTDAGPARRIGATSPPPDLDPFSLDPLLLRRRHLGSGHVHLVDTPHLERR